MYKSEWYNYLFLYGHGQISNILWDKLIDNCGVNHLKYNYEPIIEGKEDACQQAEEQVSKEVGGYYSYNLYDDCTYQNSVRRMLRSRIDSHNNHGNSNGNSAVATDVTGSVNDYICGGGEVLNQWTNNDHVRRALHVSPHANFFSGDNAVGMNYTLTEKNLMPFFTHMAKNTPSRVMVYNGDTDPGINSFAAQNWTVSLNLKEIRAT